MTEATVAFLDYLRNIGKEQDADFLRDGIQVLTQALMEVEISQQVGAERYERRDARQGYRNGYRERLWQTRVGDIALRIPKGRDGSYFPSFLEPRRRPEQALLALVQQAYIEGVSTRKVDDLVQSLGLSGMDKSAVSRICQQLDAVVDAFRNRPLASEYPYVWLDAVYVKARVNGRVVSQALVIATGVRRSGERDVLGLEVGAAENHDFWLDFLRQLVRRGLRGVQLVISDAHEGLKEAIQQVFAGASWQRCRVHFMRNVLAYVPHGEKALVSALLRTIFAQSNRPEAEAQWQQLYEQMRKRWPLAASVMAEAREDVLAYMHFRTARTWSMCRCSSTAGRPSAAHASCWSSRIRTAFPNRPHLHLRLVPGEALHGHGPERRLQEVRVAPPLDLLGRREPQPRLHPARRQVGHALAARHQRTPRNLLQKPNNSSWMS